MMRTGKLAKHRVGCAGSAGLFALALALAACRPAAAQNAHAPPDPSARAPLAIASEGSFYAGGHYDPDHPAHHVVGQIYVDYRIPQDRRHPFPIVLVHGGNQTGSGWFSTPDGRPGWAPYFLRQGYAVYVVDQVARGRSGFVPEVYGTTAAQPLQYVLEKFTSQERYKLWPQASLHTQWPGRGEPGDPAFDQYWSSDVPGMFNRTPQAQMNVEALAALFDKIGPAILLVHSQSGGYAWPLAQARPQLVKAIVAAEPAGPPVHDVRHRRGDHEEDAGEESAPAEARRQRTQRLWPDHRAASGRRAQAHAAADRFPTREVRYPGGRRRRRVRSQSVGAHCASALSRR